MNNFLRTAPSSEEVATNALRTLLVGGSEILDNVLCHINVVSKHAAELGYGGVDFEYDTPFHMQNMEVFSEKLITPRGAKEAPSLPMYAAGCLAHLIKLSLESREYSVEALAVTPEGDKARIKGRLTHGRGLRSLAGGVLYNALFDVDAKV